MEDSAKPTGSPTPNPATNTNVSLWSIQWKILVLIFLIASTVFGAMLWKTDSLLNQDKIAFVNDSAMKQIAPLKRLVQQRLADEKSALIAFAGTRLAQRSPTPGGGNFGNFDVVSLVSLNANAGISQATPTWVERNPGLREDRWPTGHDQTLLKSLPYARVHDGEVLWTRVSDRQGSPVYAMMISVDIQPAAGKDTTAAVSSSLPETAEQTHSSATTGSRAVLVGFTSANPLAEVTEDFIGSTNTVYIVDDRGYVASHVNKSYLGALFNEDPIVRDILRGRKSGATGKFEDLESRSVLGHYERIEHSNLFAVITTPEAILSTMVGSQRTSALQVGLAVLLLCFAFGVGLSRWIARQAVRLEVPRPIEPVDPEPEVREKPPALPAPAVVNTPVSNRVLSDSFVRALTEPVHGILAHANLVHAKATDDEIGKHAASITREARRLRDLVERLHEWEDRVLEEPVFEALNVNDVINRSLKKREGELASENIHVLRELRPVPDIQGSAARLERALDEIINNAFEALRGRMAKRVKIETDFSDTGVSLRITDTGVGMSRDVRDSAFEPFTKAFQSTERLGLGLSEVAATVQAMNGSQSIESSPGEGSVFVLRFPVSETDRAIFADRERAGFIQPVKAAPIREETPLQTVEPTVTPEEQHAAPLAPTPAPEIPPAVSTDEEFFAPQIREEILDDEPSDDDIEIMFNRPITAPIHTLEEPAVTGPLMLDELDDDDEIFANVPLSKAITKPTKVGQLTETPRVATAPTPTPPPAPTPKVSEKFEVKIRKPQTRVRPRRPTERDLE